MDAIEAIMLRTLSMNSRFSIKKLAARMGQKTSTTYDRVRALEKSLGIRYILEIRPEALGYYPYIATARFNGRAPETEVIKAAFENDPNMQLATLTNGDVDMFCYFLVRDSMDVVEYLWKLGSASPFKEYEVKWSATPYYSAYEFVPLREKFFDMLEKTVWQRTRDRPRPENGQLTRNEYEVLKALNGNAAMDFADLDRTLGLDKGMSHYIYNRLLEKAIIKRPTMTMEKLPVRHSTFYSMEVTKSVSFEETREYLLRHIIGNGHHMANRYSLAGNTLNPLGTVYVAPSLLSEDRILEDELNAVKGVNLSKAVITDVPIGAFCYRFFDNAHSGQYKALIEEFKKEKFLDTVDYGC